MPIRVLIFFVSLFAVISFLPSYSLGSTVTIASPGSGATVGSQVNISGYVSSGTVTKQMAIYIDYNLYYKLQNATSISATATLPAGSHHLTIQAWLANSSTIIKTSETFTVMSSNPSPSPTPASNAATGSLSATSVDFGSVAVGVASPVKSVTFKNIGTATLTLSGSFVFSSADFFWGPNGNCPSSLAPGANCIIDFYFRPSSAGAKTASITINSNATNAPEVINLSGTGVTSTSSPTPAPSPVASPSPSSSSGVSISISPGSTTLGAFASQQFYATVSGTTNQSVNWLVNGVIGGDAANGTISNTGLYTTPPCASVQSVTITAQSAANTTVKASGIVTLNNATASNLRFVSVTGSDSNDGTGCRPYRTIRHAAGIVNPGDRVIVEDGTYSETVVASRAGTSTAQIVFRSMNKWGAKIAPPSTTSSVIFDIAAPYITLQDFEIIGTPNVAVAVKAHLEAPGAKILGNNVHSMGNGTTIDVGYGPGCLSGAAIEPSGDNQVTNGNVVWDIGWHRDRMTGGQNGQGQCHQQHGIYITAGKNSFVQNNIIYSVYQGYSIHVNASINYYVITNNTLFGGGDSYHNDGGPIILECEQVNGVGCDYNTISNNIVSNWQRDPWGFGCFSEMAGGGTFGTHNVWANNLTDNTCDMSQDHWITGHDSGTIVADPQYVNYTGSWTGNYHLKSTSPAINAAVGAGAPSVDYDGFQRPYGSAPDIGAYEWHP